MFYLVMGQLKPVLFPLVAYLSSLWIKSSLYGCNIWYSFFTSVYLSAFILQF